MANRSGLILTGLAVLLCAPTARPADERSRMEITLERKDDSGWKSVDPTLVLGSGDRVRFRFKANFNGYLYVTNYGTSGNSMLLFPRQETGRNNIIQSGKEYLIPSTDAAFRIEGPAGYESVFWLVSPVALGEKLDFSPSRSSNYRPPVLTPRCDDTMMRARGLCMDTEAGPRAVQEKDKLPDEIAPLRPATPRELTIVQKRNQSVLSPAGPASGPVLYEFRLAHK